MTRSPFTHTQAPSPQSPSLGNSLGAGQGFGKFWTAAILFLVMAVTMAGNIYWVHRNVVMVGHDATSYLETSIKYTRFFTDLALPQLFQALTFPDYRTPMIFIATQPFLHLFGINMDGAQALNIALLPLVVLATFALGKRVSGATVGLAAAIIVAFLPLMTAMARLYYVEILLTAVITFNLWALYRSKQFTSWRWSILWGASAGIGLLTKWTFPMYVFLPTAWVLWRSDLWRTQLDWLRHPRLGGKAVAVAVVIGMAAALLWFWPNRAAAQEFLLGNWLLLGWTILASLTAYSLLTPTNVLSNWWAGFLIALTIASLWYLPYIDFPLKLLEIDRVRAPEGASPSNLSNYTRYFGFFYREHLGPLAFWLLIPAGFFPWLRAWVRRSTLNSDALLLWLSVLSAYVVLSLILQHNARNLVPLLPQVAILLAIGLSCYGRRTAQAIGAVWLVVLVGQWCLFTFQPLSPIFAAAKPLWADSNYVVPPASETTDPGYWIAPDVLAAIGDPAGEADSLGILVETWEVHRGLFRYLATRDGQNLTITALTEDDSRGWSDLLASRWLLLNKGDNHHVAEPGRAALQRIEDGDPLFDQLYDVVAEYPLPDGDTIVLYQRQAGPRQPLDYPVVLIETAGIADAINRNLGPDATLFFSSPDTAAWIGIHDLHADRVKIADDKDQLEMLLTDASGPIFLVSRYDTEEVRTTLDGSDYLASEVGDGEFHLTIFGRPTEPLTSLPVTSGWDAVEITDLKSQTPIRPGHVLPIYAMVDGRTDGSLKISLRLMTPDGDTVAQRDLTLTPEVKLGLMVPPQSEAGEYMLAGVVYDAATAEPIVDRSGNQVSPLATIEVAALD